MTTAHYQNVILYAGYRYHTIFTVMCECSDIYCCGFVWAVASQIKMLLDLDDSGFEI